MAYWMLLRNKKYKLYKVEQMLENGGYNRTIDWVIIPNGAKIDGQPIED